MEPMYIETPWDKNLEYNYEEYENIVDEAMKITGGKKDDIMPLTIEDLIYKCETGTIDSIIDMLVMVRDGRDVTERLISYLD